MDEDEERRGTDYKAEQRRGKVCLQGLRELEI